MRATALPVAEAAIVDDMDIVRDRTSWPPRRRYVRLSPEAERWLPTIKRRLVRGFHPDAIVLFGSQARGEAGSRSDIDLLVILPTVDNRRQAAAEMYASLEGIPAGTDIFVASTADIDRYHDANGTMIRPALAEGTLIYARS